MANHTDVCTVSFCDRPVVVKIHQLCNGHYLQMRAGKPYKELRFSRAALRGAATCAAEDCNAIANASRGLCNRHYWRFRKFGDADVSVARERKAAGEEPPPCAIDGCEGARQVRDWCQSHYNQWRRNPESLGRPIKKYGDPKARDEQGNKYCRTCSHWRPVSDFNKAPSTSDQLQLRCKPCVAAIYRANAEVVRDKMREQRFGLSREQFDEILESQGGTCAICKSLSPGSSFWHVDHDHDCCPSSDKTCGQCVRGILCSLCNTGLGHLRDDTDILRTAIAYLEHHSLATRLAATA
jgi:hypothetical protein